MNRRTFTSKTALGILMAPLASDSLAAGFFKSASPVKGKITLGMDGHSVRGMRWKAHDLINYASTLNVGSVLFNSMSYFKSLDNDYLQSVSKLLTDKDLRFYFGVGSLSVNSTTYNEKFGNPQQLIEKGIRLAKIFNTPAVTCKIGNVKDRYTDGGIGARMEEIIKELKAMRSQIQDAGIKFAVENHAGDLRAEEVITIIEEVGTDICGAMVDPGNSVWSMEDPVEHLQKLGKYALCTSIRNYRIWPSDNGATFQWTAVGEGSVDFQKYTQLMAELCPGVPLHVESISDSPREIPYLTDEYWQGFPDLKAKDLTGFYNRVKNGSPIDVAAPPLGADENQFWQERQKSELNKSIAWLRENCPEVEGAWR